MLKKIVVSTLLLGLLGGLTVGGDAFSYLSTAFGRASATVERAVPVEFQLDRARQMVRNLAPEVRHSMEVIAKEEIELERLGEKIETAAEKADRSKNEIMRLQSDLTEDRDVFRYAGHNYDRCEVVEDLSRRFTRHKVADETLEHLRDMQQARTANLDAARQKLTAMIAAQKELETDIMNLEAKRQLVEVAQASNDVVALDESQLSRAKGLIADIRSRLDVASRLANADTTFPGEIQLDPAESHDVREQVAAYFGLGDPTVTVSAAKGGKVAAVSATIQLD
ncbi:hypothetical protein Pla108_08210 [Botrimarina colliarenosi]|uniref:Uncharacterized protein n=1 Tax=Botrimarina colliarenosi TaxID=2528001 RepID=A0A5C6AKU3_9BACT|nr:hypothetical protein [Botrimarina colliarenosi]TWT99878.1 hypothetical protein Pla108_08210 [Botrimarina colliarenosi]